MQRLLRWTKGSSTADADAVDEGSNNSNSEADDIYDTESDGDGASVPEGGGGDHDKPTTTAAEVISSQYYEEGGDISSDRELVRKDKDRGESDIDIAEPSTASQVFNDNAVENHVSTGLLLIDGKEFKPNTPTLIPKGTDTEEHDSKCDERGDDIFPQAEEFLIDMNDDTITLANQATEIVDGFNEDDNDNANIHGENIEDDAKTIATHRTTGTRVHPISSAFRSSVTNKEEKGDEHNSMMQHPHQSIYDILDRNFEQLGNSGSSVKMGGRQIGHKDVKLCFVAFVAVFRLPSDPPFIQENLNSTAIIDDTPTDQKANNDKGGGSVKDDNTKGEKQSSSDDNNTGASRLRVPLSVAFALWCEVLRRLGHTETTTNQSLSYIRSTLVLLGMLSIAKMDRDRDDGVASTFGSSLPGVNSSKSIDCLVVQDRIHQQYGEYLVWGNHSGPYRSQIEMNRRRWNEAVRIESEQIGSNYFTLRMLPLHTMRAHHFQETFDLLKDKTFVRRRIPVLGAMRAARAHVSDMDELLRLIESYISSGDTFLEPIDEREGLLGAYQQMLKFCLHETEELSKCNKDENGNTNLKLGKAAMLKSAQIGNAVHLLGTSLGGYGFFDEEMQYYRNALEVKTLSENGNIDKSVSASDTLHSMGFSLDNAGKRDEALVCYNQALSIRYACIGEDDLRVAETLHNKGALLCEEDRGDEAMECLEEALRIREIHYGEEHESCADTMQWMGNCLRKYGDPSEALDYFKFALSIKRKMLGSDDIDVANTLFNTAVLLDDIEKYELSLVAYTEALRIRKLVLGKKNQEVAGTLFCMGNVATVLENHQSALAYYNESIEIMEEVILNDDNVANGSGVTLLFLSNPISLRPNLESCYKKLIQCFEEALPLTKLILGTNHSKVGDLLRRMGEIYMKLHDWDNAIGSFQGALRVKRSDASKLEDDVQVAELLQKKGEAYMFKNEFNKAKATFDSSIQIEKRLFGMKDSLSLASFTCCLGAAYYHLDDFAHAKLFFQEGMRINSQLAGSDESSIIYSLCWLGRLHRRMNEPQEALERYLSALQRCKKILSIDYRVVVHLLHVIGEVYEEETVNLQQMSLKCYSKEIDLIHSRLEMEELQTRRMLADAHYHSGILLKKLLETERSIEQLEKALEATKTCYGESSIQEATVADNLGMLHASKSDFVLAKKYYSSAYSAYEIAVGREDLRTSDCAFRLGSVLEALASNLALDFYKESLRVRRLHVAVGDERVAETLFYIARLLHMRDAHQDALACLEESLDIRKRLFDDCVVVAETYHNIGKVYNKMSQGEKALIFFRESLRINKKVRNEALYQVSLDMAQCAASCTHYQLAIECYTECLQLTKGLNNTLDAALVMQKIGEIQLINLHSYTDARKIFLDALEIQRSIDSDGCNGNEIANLLLLIAQASARAKDYDDALDFYEEYIDLLESNFPEQQQQLADSLYAMGNILVAIDPNPDYDLSIEKFNECIDIKRSLHGADSEEVATVLYALATVYEQAGFHEKAINSLSEALRAFKMNNDKGGSVKVYTALAKLKASKATESHSVIDYTAAIECFREALRIRRQIMSVDDIELASILYDYASLLCMNSDHESALPMLEEALQIQKSISGLKNERVANILLQMAGVYVQQEQYDASLVSLEQVLLIQSSLHPGDSTNDSIDLGLCYFLLGKTYRAQSEFHNSISSYLECIQLKQTKFGANSLECAVVHNELGEAYGKVKDFCKAIESLVQALKIRKHELGNNSIEYGDSVFNLAKIHGYMGKHDQALNCLDEAMRVFELSTDDVSKTLAEVYETKGDTLYEVNQSEVAASMFQACIDLLCSSGNDGVSIARLNHKQGRAFAKHDRFVEACDAFHEAIRIFGEMLGKDDLSVGEVMYDLGLLLVDQGGQDASEKAMTCFNETVRIYDLQGKGNTAKAADAIVQKCSLLVSFDESSSLLNQAIEIYKESLGEDAAEIGNAMLLYGKLHEAQHHDDEAMASFNEALRIFQIAFGDDDINVSISLSNIGSLHAKKLEYSEAVYKCKRALKMRVSLGEQKEDIADSVFNIGIILNDWGKPDEALEYFQQALKMYIHLAGNEHISVAKCKAKLGAHYLDRKDFDRSLPFFLHALRFFVKEHEDNDDVHNTLVASLYRGIGDCYFYTGEYDKALENFAKCIQTLKREHGDDWIEMAAPYDYIGLIYQKEESHDEAINFHSKALLIQENFHGRGSKECAASDFNIAKCLLASQNYEDCISRLRDHLELFCDEYYDDEELANVYHLLGLAQKEIGEHEDSMSTLNRVLDIRTKTFGKSSIQVAEILLDIAKVLEELGDSDQAITLYDQALSLFHDLSYSDYRAVAGAYSHLGTLFDEKGDIEASLHSWKEALKIISNISGNNSSEVAEILYHIGIVYDQLGNYDKSTKCLSESIKIFRTGTEGDSMIAVSLGYIGKNYMRKQQYAKAVEVSTESLRLKKQHARAEDIAESLVDLGNILDAWGKPDQAIQFFDEALRTYIEALGLDSAEVASCKHSIALVKKSLGETEEALRYFGEALRIHRLKEGDKSLNVADILFQIGQIYISFGDKNKAVKCFEECLRVRKEILGEDHLDVLAAQRFVGNTSKP